MNNGFYTVLSKIYDLMDIIYFSDRTRSPREKILACIPNDKIKVIDVCCGTMSNSLSVAVKRPKVQIVGLDMSKSMLRIAQKKIGAKGIDNAHVKVGDATNINCKDNTFDYAILGLVLHETNEELSKDIGGNKKNIET